MVETIITQIIRRDLKSLGMRLPIEDMEKIIEHTSERLAKHLQYNPPERTMVMVRDCVIGWMYENRHKLLLEQVKSELREVGSRLQLEVKNKLGLEAHLDPDFELVPVVIGKPAAYDPDRDRIIIAAQGLLVKESYESRKWLLYKHELIHHLHKQISRRVFEKRPSTYISRYDKKINSNMFNFEGFALWFSGSSESSCSKINSLDRLLTAVASSDNPARLLSNIFDDEYSFGAIVYDTCFRAFGSKKVLRIAKSYLTRSEMLSEYNKAIKKLGIKAPQFEDKSSHLDLVHLYRELIKKNGRKISQRTLSRVRRIERGVKEVLARGEKPSILCWYDYCYSDLLEVLHASRLNYHYLFESRTYYEKERLGYNVFSSCYWSSLHYTEEGRDINVVEASPRFRGHINILQENSKLKFRIV